VWAALIAMPAASAAAADIVLYASDATNLHGNWSRASDTSTAGGQLLTSADNGYSSTAAPLVSPANYFDFTFTAAANTPYRLWLRLRASGGSKYNDSVFAQFSDAVTTQGAAMYRIGTTNGLNVNLQSCDGCVLSGWGWIDSAYWLSQQPTVSFPTSGTHTLRIQTREDGVQLDEVVLSPSTYLSASPGQVLNDTTRVFKPAAATSTPYSGTPAAIPGTVQAENFDNGGEGVAYHDTTSGNAGGVYRSTDVDLAAGSGGGYVVGWVSAGEWLNYTVNVASAGTYTASFRIASLGQGGTFHLTMNGTDVTGSITVPDTGGWQNWQNVTRTVTLAAGVQTARLVMDTSGVNAVGNFDSMTFTSGGGGTTIAVPAGGDLQSAINNAKPGDTITLAAGAVYAGAFVLPVKSGTSYITIRSSTPDAQLPAAGVRIEPQYASKLAKVQGGFAGQSAFATVAGAHHFRLQFLEIVDTYANTDIVKLGAQDATQTTLAAVAHDLIVDRCYIHGDATNGQKRGIALNSATTSVIDSYISNIKSTISDAQAIQGSNGPGPYVITNNYLEASGENILFGGADPFIASLVPSDITIRQNYISKPMAWRSQGWTVKNLIELKNAQRVTIDGNLIENNWAAAQSGFAIVLTPRNQDGTAPWSVVQQIQITNNLVRHVASVFNLLGQDNLQPSRMTTDVTIRNNLFLDVSHTSYGGAGTFMLTNGGDGLTIDQNTVFTDGTQILSADGAAVLGLTFTNNIVPDNAYAIKGTATAAGTATVAKFYPGAIVRRNVFIGGHSATYPTDNFYPASVTAVGFVDLSGGNYALTAASPYANAATDGTAVGADQTAILALVPQAP
jgi:hypothetical protein